MDQGLYTVLKILDCIGILTLISGYLIIISQSYFYIKVSEFYIYTLSVEATEIRKGTDC